jgi:cell division protein FtsB
VAVRVRFGRSAPRTARLRRRPDARSAVRFLTDALPLDDPARIPTPDPAIERKERVKRGTIMAILAVLFVVGLTGSIFGPRGDLDVRRAKLERDRLQAEVDAQQLKVMALRKEVQRLEADPFATERIAREKLGYVREGEITFILPGDAAPPPGSIHAAPPKDTGSSAAAGPG